MTKQEYLDEARAALVRVFELGELEALEALEALAQDVADLIDDAVAVGAGVPVAAESRR